MADKNAIDEWILNNILPTEMRLPTLPPTGTPLDASPRPTPEHMGKAALGYLKERTLHNVGNLDKRPSKFYGRKPGTEGIYREDSPEDWQIAEVDPPGGKLFKAAGKWKRGIKPAFGKLGEYKSEKLYTVGHRNDLYSDMAQEIAFDMGAVKTHYIKGHRTPYTAYFKTRKEAEAYAEQIGTSADYISAETRSLPDTPFQPMHPEAAPYGNTKVSENPAKYRQPTKGAKPVRDADKYKFAGEMVDGRKVRPHVPNTDSIGATFYDPKQLSGIREVPLSEFEAPPEITKQTLALAEEIKKTGEINPLIVAIDEEGPYILEGAHRYDALKILKAKSMPAVIVGEKEDIDNWIKLYNKATKGAKPVKTGR